jgi:hypothetical protein
MVEKILDGCIHYALRRWGYGMQGRKSGAKWGRSPWQPEGKVSRITSDPGKSGGAIEIRGSGRRSRDERDNITLSEQRTRGSKRLSWRSEAALVDNAGRNPQEGLLTTKAMSNRKATQGVRHVVPSRLSTGRAWLICFDFKPDWGKPAVRNFRGSAGNVTMGAGLRPTVKTVEMPPDPTVNAPVLYPTDKK